MAQISTQICRMCSESNGVFYCYECQHALCTICRERHDMIPATRGHTITNTSTIDLAVLSKKSQCLKHDKEFLFFCVKCSVFICSTCVISTHKDHSFSGISETVSEEREKAKLQITDLRAKIEPISCIQDKVRCYTDQLHVDSKKCIETINNVSKDLQTFIETRKNIKTTEVEDNETWEQQSYKSFMKNIKQINKQYTQIISELESLLSEKHDITFHSCYGVINTDIQNLVNVPTVPTLAPVPSFENKMLYQEIIAHMESKVDDSCTDHQEKIDQILTENEKLKTELERCSTQMTQKDDEIRSLTLQIKSLKDKCSTQMTQKDDEIRSLTLQIKSLKDKCTTQMTQKDEEIRRMMLEIEGLKDKLKDVDVNQVEGYCIAAAVVPESSSSDIAAAVVQESSSSENNNNTDSDGDDDFRCFRCNERGHFARECTAPPNIECYECREIGHYSRDCPNRLCYNCGQPGHFARECSDRESDSDCFTQSVTQSVTGLQQSVNNLAAGRPESLENRNTYNLKQWYKARNHFDVPILPTKNRVQPTVIFQHAHWRIQQRDPCIFIFQCRHCVTFAKKRSIVEGKDINLAVNHVTQFCSLKATNQDQFVSKVNGKVSNKSIDKQGRQRIYVEKREVCNNFNNPRGYFRSTCNLLHACLKCKSSGHAAMSCRKQQALPSSARPSNSSGDNFKIEEYK
ncbi:CNBP [Mytilus coruscus]|uniref:CNBP n=1 Tax=Mytilus coruscus TaxID=42192 RepID=A0A6J8D754_MYTCO|nr:CNBP [Mytilus coruscus]